MQQVKAELTEFFKKQDSLEYSATPSKDNSPFNFQALAPKLALVNEFDGDASDVAEQIMSDISVHDI